MRNGQNKRMRGRNRKSHNPMTRVYESNGPDVKIRGTASHIAEKYVQLARDAQASGDPVAAENYYQHAEHYFRMIAAAQEQFRQSQPFYRPEGGDVRNDENFDDGDDSQPGQGEPHIPQRDFRDQQQSYPPRDQQQHQPREHQQHQPRDQQQHQQYQPQQHQPRDNHGQRPQPQPSADAGDVGGLPSFITGAPQSHQGYGPNGYDNQPDRFPLHRRRRRHHRGPRPDMPGGQPDFGGEAPDEAAPSTGPQSPGPQPGNE